MARMHVPAGMRSRGDFQAVYHPYDALCDHASVCEDVPFSHLYANDAPEVRLLEEEDTYWLTAELDGIHQDDITVWVDANTLRIRGEWRETDSVQHCALAVRPYRMFARQFHLDKPVEPDTISTTYVDGVLTVSIRKVTPAQTEQAFARIA